MLTAISKDPKSDIIIYPMEMNPIVGDNFLKTTCQPDGGTRRKVKGPPK